MHRNKKILTGILGLIFLISFASAFNFEGNGVKIVEPLESNGAIPVNIQDQTTAPIIAYMSKIDTETNLTDSVLLEGKFINVTNVTGFTAGSYISIFSVSDNRFYLGSALGVVGNTVELDTPLDFGFPAGSFVTAGTRNLNVDGSGTPVIFGLRNTEEAIGTSFDITRIILTCLADDSTVDLSKFCDISGGLQNGIVFRKKDGIYQNLFNAKTNGELKNLMFDFDIDVSANPAQGQDGFTGRLTFGGQEKMGVVIRLDPGEDIQIIIQDDLSTLQNFAIIAEGHVVTD